MFDWLTLAIALLKLVNAIVSWAHDNGMINEGRRQVLAELAANIAAKSAVKKQIEDEVDGMDEAQVDKELSGLVDPPARGKS